MAENSSSTDNRALLDKDQALEQAGGSESLARELFGMLLDDLPVLRQQLQQAIADDRADAMWDHAHKLYGSTVYCGVPALREAARAMEECIKQQNKAELTACFAQLAAEIERLLEQGPQLTEQLRRDE
ncbi:Hpt domain-containing protein [Thiohalophilus thiocyanatoxydans]|uniref:HPt (Histidine-containing phosphotransfer) domain-containing protein n=1 Tax=Thiohalophilus thiocyanatoxydans TaxID=381308 RepID=A0A4R8IYR3_9GAMM|nr:Hpt domain-containing protein [Thiohalophilus thiocyanatoxydans]TDY02979.1 HPt (histidine-containing phosphotransfer) domain-containing protein [Thiohalophilus thiocyanatoxydans]